ncbi:MAG: phage holin family protein, partial [Anaerolineae bacterium]
MLRQVRNFVSRLSIHYLLLSALLLLRGITRDQQLFGVWIVAFVFTVLTVSVRRLLLILTLPLIIMTGGLFIFVVDGAVLALTAALTGLNINNFWWALLGVLVMSGANIWIGRIFSALGWWRDAEPGSTNVMTRRSPSWWLRLTLVVVLLFGIVYSAAMAAQIFLAVSILTTNMTVIALTAGVGFALLVLGVGWLVAEGLALDRRARFSIISAAVAT